MQNSFIYRNIPHVQSLLTCGSQLCVEVEMPSHTEISLTYRAHSHEDVVYTAVAITCVGHSCVEMGMP